MANGLTALSLEERRNDVIKAKEELYDTLQEVRALSTLRGLRGAPEVPPLCRETQSLGQQMLP